MVGIVRLWEEGGKTLIPVDLQEDERPVRALQNTETGWSPGGGQDISDLTVLTHHWGQTFRPEDVTRTGVCVHPEDVQACTRSPDNTQRRHLQSSTYIVDFTVDASFLLVFLFLLILLLFLVFLRDDVVQVAEVMLGEQVVHGLTDGHQRQNLQTGEVEVSASITDWKRRLHTRHAGSPHHDGEDDGGHRGLEDPEEGEAQALDEGEEVDASLGDVTQVDQVWLVLGRHQEELQAIHELQSKHARSIRRHSTIVVMWGFLFTEACRCPCWASFTFPHCRNADGLWGQIHSPGRRSAMPRPCRGTRHRAQAWEWTEGRRAQKWLILTLSGHSCRSNIRTKTKDIMSEVYWQCPAGGAAAQAIWTLLGQFNEEMETQVGSDPHPHAYFTSHHFSYVECLIGWIKDLKWFDGFKRGDRSLS